MKNTRRSRLGELLSETTSKGYFARAQQRGSRRKSPWNLLDLLGFVWAGAVWWLFLRGIWAARNFIVPQHAVELSTLFRSQSGGVSTIILAVAPLIAALPVGMLLSNFFLWYIPPYRRACDREAQGVWHASYTDCQKDLVVFALYIGCPLLLLSFVAALLWHP
jgi:hypothetical protein